MGNGLRRHLVSRNIDGVLDVYANVYIYHNHTILRSTLRATKRTRLHLMVMKSLVYRCITTISYCHGFPMVIMGMFKQCVPGPFLGLGRYMYEEASDNHELLLRCSMAKNIMGWVLQTVEFIL